MKKSSIPLKRLMWKVIYECIGAEKRRKVKRVEFKNE